MPLQALGVLKIVNSTMKIASWNVNSLNVRLSHVLTWLESKSPDILAIQETKLTDEKFPVEAFAEAGWSIVFTGQKTYNGVAIISKTAAQDIVSIIPGYTDPQKRFIAATYNNLRIINLYVVNGKQVGSDKYAYKLEWIEQVTHYLVEQLTQHKNIVVLGDFNIAPTDQDVHDPKLWQEKILCSTLERDALQKIINLGFEDTFRLFTQEEKQFSWWDYRAAAFRRKLGLRIDLILASHSLVKACTQSWIDQAPRSWERPSDHAPVIAEFDFSK